MGTSLRGQLTVPEDFRSSGLARLPPAQARDLLAWADSSGDCTSSTLTTRPAHSFTSPLDHLAALARNDIRYGTDPNTPVEAISDLMARSYTVNGRSLWDRYAEEFDHIPERWVRWFYPG